MHIISNLAQYVYIVLCVNFNNLLIIAPITVTNLQTCISGQHFLPRKLIEVKDRQQKIILTRFLPRNSNLFVLLFWNALTSPVHLTYCLLEGFTGFFLTSVPSCCLVNFLIPNIPKTDLGSSQIVESDGSLGIAKTSNVPSFYTYFINQKFLIQS